MREDLIDLLCCPDGCDENLNYHDVTYSDDEIVDGEIRCPGCGRLYPIREGIPQLMPGELIDYVGRNDDSAISAKLSEMSARDDQVEAYDKMWYLSLYGLVEIPMTLSMLSMASDHAMLEGGCGTGRMTQIFAHRCRRLISVDFSWESLLVNRSKLRRKGVRNVDLIQADLCHLPIKTESVDRVASCGVLEHIPTHDTRVKALKGMCRVLKVGGNMALSAYNYSLLMRMFGEREGEHAGGIYFVRFTGKELYNLLSEAIPVEHISSSLVYYHHARCRKTESYVPMEKEAIVI